MGGGGDSYANSINRGPRGGDLRPGGGGI